MPFWKWSKTNDNNGNADPFVNWAEGMDPAAVNDSARSMMARLKEYGDDVAMAGTTAGTSTAYTLLTNQGFNIIPPTGAAVSFVAHVTSGFNPTLAIDSGNAYPIWGVNNLLAPPGTLRQGVLYSATFVGAGWLLQNTVSNFTVPLGGLMDYTALTLPPGGNFVFPYGQALSRTVYSDYFALVGTAYGVGDGSSTFNVPNLKGRMVATLDNLGNGASAGVLNLVGGGTTLGAVGGNQTISIGQINIPAYTLVNGSGVSSVSGTTWGSSNDHYHAFSGSTGGMNQNQSHSHTGHSQFQASQGDDGNPASAIVTDGVEIYDSNKNTINVIIDYTNTDHAHAFSGNTGGISSDHTHPFNGYGTASSIQIASGGSSVPLNGLPPIITLPKILRVI